jgi:hypothetical protein
MAVSRHNSPSDDEMSLPFTLRCICFKRKGKTVEDSRASEGVGEISLHPLGPNGVPSV